VIPILSKRIFAIIVFITMCSSIVLAQTPTAPSVGDGTAGNPYQIATLENLYWITQNSSTWGSYFIQTANINASATSGWSGGAGMPTIGNSSPSFSGNYNGQGFFIYGLYINKSSDFTGLFGYVVGTVKNVKLYNITVVGDRYVGGLAGGSQGDISNCAVTGSVSGSAGSIRFLIGGLVGANYKNIDSCFSTATVSGYYDVGGLVGYSSNSIYHISNSFATGSVSGISKVGGLVGSLNSSNNIINCYATGAVTASSNGGGLIGSTDGSAVTISNSFWDTQTSGQASSAGGGTGKTTAEMKTSSTFTSSGWNFTAPWGMNSTVNNGYPYLNSLTTPPSISSFTPSMNAGNISASSNIVMVFSEPMNASSFVAGTSIIVIGSRSGRHSGSITYTAGTFTATYDPTTNFLPGEHVTVIVTTQAVSAIGAPLASPLIWQFSVQSTSSDTLGTLVNVATVPTAIVPAAADLDNDGDVDIATANYTANTISIFLNSGSRTFAAPVTYSLSASVRSVSSADIDNDGDMDLIAAVDNSSVAILKNNGNGTFAAAVSYSVGQLPTWTDVTDIDGDGDLDIASGNFTSGSISVITNNGTGVFSASTNYSAGTNSHGVHFADVDGDKDMDMIGAGYGASNIGVYLNNGSGSFGSMTSFASGANPMDVRLADLDGDGDVDAVTPNAGGNSVSVFMNNGNGTFAAKTDYAVALLPYMVIPADVDGDGDIDLAVSCVNGLALNVLRNNGSGTFTAASYPMGFGVAGVAVADMDGDGKMDIVLTSHTDNLVKVLYAGAPSGKSLSFNGTDGFGKVTIPTPTAYTIEMWVKPADVTSRIIGAISDDTGPATSYNTHQIGITSDHKFQHYLYDGQLRFVTGTTTVVAGQWYHVAITASNNGQMRLFVNGAEEGTAVSIGTMFASVNTYFFGMASPQGSAYTGAMDNMRIWNIARTGSQITGAMFTEISGAQSGLLANYHGYEYAGTSAYDSSGNNRTLNLKGSGYSWSASNFPAQPNVASFSPAANANTFSRSGNITATFSIPMDSTSFVFGSTVKVTGSHSGVHSGTISLSNQLKTMTFDPAADFSAGEKVEVLLTTGIESVDNFSIAAKKYWSFTVQSAASDSFDARTDIAVGTGAYELQPADLDGDGDIDLVVISTDVSQISILLNNGSGSFSAGSTYAAGGTPTGVATADIDNDNDIDLVYTRYIDDLVSVMKNNGDGTFAARTDYATGDLPMPITLADVDNDGDVDILTSNNNSGTISLLKNNGDGTFAAKTDFSSSYGRIECITAGDMDGDGDIDLVLPYYSWGNLAVFLNNGSGTFTLLAQYSIGNKPRWTDLADIDGDGDLDVAVAVYDDHQVQVLKNTGNGTLSSAVSYSVGNNPSSVRFADLNGDGYVDLGSSNLIGNSYTFYRNDGAGTFVQRTDYAAGQYPYSLKTFDADGDGDVDAVSANYGASTVSVLLNMTFQQLPVELVTFTASARKNIVELQWNTATEVNNYGFEIEKKRKKDEVGMMKWEKIGFVEGNGTTNAPKEYSFTDKILTAGKYSYRLKQIDRDGQFVYSQAVEVTVGNLPKVFALEQNYPNPFNPGTTIGFTLQESGMTTLKIYDAIGREVAVLVNEVLEAGIHHRKQFDATSLSSGIYFTKLNSAGETRITKMLLIK
jgi:hypothetical protein